MGKRRRGEGSRGPGEDQFGDTMTSQDRDFSHHQFSGSGFKGGGSAGGRGRGGMDVKYQRSVPKFLQKYSHLMGKGFKGDDEEPAVVAEPVNMEFEEDEDDAGAVARALEDNPELAAELGEHALNRVKAAEEKEKGNEAFAKKDYDAALKHFTRCIELDGRNEVYYSNRAAVHAAMKQWNESMADAKLVTTLKPGWVKGWARLAAAHMGLEEWSQAKDVYERALRIESDDQTLKKGLEKAMMMEAKEAGSNRHKFNTRDIKTVKRKKNRQGGAGADGSASNKKLLSFGGDDDEDDADGSDADGDEEQ